MKNIMETATASGQFKTLVAAVEAAGWAEMLQAGQYTVFAPTDDAFAKLPAGTVKGLLRDLPRLKSILAYHVMPGKVLAQEVAGLKAVKTMQGGEIRVDANHGVKINNATVIQADIEASNGVIHVIDSVLLPA